MSAIDSFAQTQMSKYSKHYSKLGQSRIDHRLVNPSLSALGNALDALKFQPLNPTDISPQILRKGGHDESMSLTPSTNDGKWHLT